MPTETVDISAFMRDFRRLRKESIPKAIVKGFAYTASHARDIVRAKTAQVFKLHSNYITKSILSIPNPSNRTQVKAAMKSLTGRHGDFTAAVFVRGADIWGQRKPSTDKDLGFMTLHEEGGYKSAHGGGYVAIPARGIEGYSFKTAKGRVKKAWKPETLLRQYNMYGPPMKGRKKRPKRSTKGSAFLLSKQRMGANYQWGEKTMIVRRKTRKRYPLELLYTFHKTSRIKKVWGFVSAVRGEVRRSLFSNVERQIRKVR